MNKSYIASHKLDSKYGVTVIKTDKYIGEDHQQELEKTLNKLHESHQPYVVIDVGDTTGISEGGLSVLLKKKFDFNSMEGDIKLANVNPGFADIMETFGFDPFFPNQGQVERAAATYGKNQDPE